MEKIDEHFENIKNNGDEMAWMMMVSSISRHYATSLEAREATVERLKNELPDLDEKAALLALGNRLINAQKAVFPRLEANAGTYTEMAELYTQYDTLKMEHLKLTNKLNAAKAALKTTLELENRH